MLQKNVVCITFSKWKWYYFEHDTNIQLFNLDDAHTCRKKTDVLKIKCLASIVAYKSGPLSVPCKTQKALADR